jgi:hypothetical protein
MSDQVLGRRLGEVGRLDGPDDRAAVARAEVRPRVVIRHELAILLRNRLHDGHDRVVELLEPGEVRRRIGLVGRLVGRVDAHERVAHQLGVFHRMGDVEPQMRVRVSLVCRKREIKHPVFAFDRLVGQLNHHGRLFLVRLDERHRGRFQVQTVHDDQVGLGDVFNVARHGFKGVRIGAFGYKAVQVNVWTGHVPDDVGDRRHGRKDFDLLPGFRRGRRSDGDQSGQRRDAENPSTPSVQ